MGVQKDEAGHQTSTTISKFELMGSYEHMKRMSFT